MQGGRNMGFTCRTSLFGVIMFLAAVFSLIPLARVSRAESTSLVFIIDASASMNETMQGRTKIGLAREMVNEILDKIPEELPVGLSFLGQRDKDTCDDIEYAVPVQGKNREQMRKLLKGLKPSGKAPVALALRKTADKLITTDDHFLNIVLVTDGRDTCEGDVFKAARDIRDKYDYQVNVDVIMINENKRESDILRHSSNVSFGFFTLIRKAGDMKSHIPFLIEKAIPPFIHYPLANTDEMALIPEGEFLMGTAKGYNADERPKHKVYLDAYYIDKYMVTQKHYRMVMGENPSVWHGSDMPVHMVDWHQAKSFCDKIGKRLPTEAEWEKAELSRSV
jgi:hypothetical protein